LTGRSAVGSPRRRLISTAEGSRAQAFGPVEWSLFAFCGLVWGGSFYLIAEAVDHFAPGVVAFLRLALGALVVAAAPAARARVERGDWPRVVFVAIVWMAVPFVLFPIAERSVASSVAGMINAGLPVFAAVIAALLLRRLPGRAQAAGLAVGLAGVALIAVPSIDDGRSSAIGVAELVIAVALYGLALNVVVPLQQRYGTLPILLRTELVAALALAPYAALGVDDSSFAWSSLGAVAALGVAGTGLAFLAMFTLVGRAGATRASAVTYLFPAVAIALGVPLRNEPLEAAAIAGTALVLAGAWLVSRRERAEVPPGA
jgi:drug/metabolite transporter (DMT)-like permease